MKRLRPLPGAHVRLMRYTAQRRTRTEQVARMLTTTLLALSTCALLGYVLYVALTEAVR